jgi:hypothetical protein
MRLLQNLSTPKCICTAWCSFTVASILLLTRPERVRYILGPLCEETRGHVVVPVERT